MASKIAIIFWTVRVLVGDSKDKLYAVHPVLPLIYYILVNAKAERQANLWSANPLE